MFIYMNYPNKKCYCCKKCDQSTFPSATDGCRPFSHPGACVPHIFSFGGDSGIFEPAAPVKRQAVPRFFYFVVTCNSAQSVGILPVSAVQNFVAFTL